MPGSIRGRLAPLVLASIALVWTIALDWSYRQATREALLGSGANSGNDRGSWF